MSQMNRRDAIQAGLVGAAAVVGLTSAHAAADKDSDERMVTSYRIELHNETGKEVFLNMWGFGHNLSTQFARSGEPFKIIGSSTYLPKGEYVYAARTVLGDIVAYGKVQITKQIPIFFLAGVDNYKFDLKKQ